MKAAITIVKAQAYYYNGGKKSKREKGVTDETALSSKQAL